MLVNPKTWCTDMKIPKGKNAGRGARIFVDLSGGLNMFFFAVCVCSFKHYGCQLLLKIWSSANVYRI